MDDEPWKVVAEQPPGEAAPESIDPLARRPNASIGWDILLWVVLGLTALVGIIGMVTYFVGLGADPADVVIPEDLVPFLQATQWIAIVIGFLGFGLVPILWVQGTRQGGWAAVKPFFRLDRPVLNTALGLVGGVVLAAIILLGFLGADALGFEQPENDLEVTLRAILTWPMAIAIALQAGITEELLFRGVIQRKVGWIWQAPLFGLMHFSQGLLGFVITGLIGLLFGYLMHRRVSLYFMIAVHFAYDMTLLGLFLLDVG